MVTNKKLCEKASNVWENSQNWNTHNEVDDVEHYVKQDLDFLLWEEGIKALNRWDTVSRWKDWKIQITKKWQGKQWLTQ